MDLKPGEFVDVTISCRAQNANEFGYHGVLQVVATTSDSPAGSLTIPVMAFP